MFIGRKLFVMFEPNLNCEPNTDHLFPKNVFPLFDSFIKEIFKKLQADTIDFIQTM